MFPSHFLLLIQILNSKVFICIIHDTCICIFILTFEQKFDYWANIWLWLLIKIWIQFGQKSESSPSSYFSFDFSNFNILGKSNIENILPGHSFGSHHNHPNHFTTRCWFINIDMDWTVDEIITSWLESPAPLSNPLKPDH